MMQLQISLLADVSTPALVLECSQLDENICRMATAAQNRGMSLRPHAKSHKCVEIARRQMAAGAIGICCATVLEAESFAKQGLERLLVTSPVVGREKTSRLVALHRKAPVLTVVDHPLQVETLVSLLKDDDAPMDVLIDIDVGQCRTGVASVEAGMELAKRIADTRRLRFAGLQAFAGHVQHIIDYDQRCGAARDVIRSVRALRDQLSAAGMAPSIISGSGTGTSSFDFSNGIFTELQVGSYIFMDADYGRLREKHHKGLPYQRSLFVMATVISENRVGQVTVDAGTKALAVNGPLPDYIIGAPPNTTYQFAGDEHGILRLPEGVEAPRLGARVLIGATHCDPTVNLYSSYVAVHAGGALELWPIVGRYRSSV
jgi:D-serine deaminase-like pyridoxal phosphate-dependent protein